jgi:pimeloyl-ACP methyl ester carboxylesterase
MAVASLAVAAGKKDFFNMAVDLHDASLTWEEKFAAIARDGGFFEELSDEHKALFIEQDRTLVISFENLDDARQDMANRLPWGMDFLTSHGWSAIGIMAHGHTWYRDPALIAFFDRLKDEKFFDRFDRVIFYGVSMGGYAATAYAACCPGADVIVVNPQATLSRAVTLGWETRFKPAWGRDFEGPYGYGPDGVREARKVWLFYDPTIPADAIHATLYTGDNIDKIRCRNMGHGMLTTWRQMGVLSKIITACIEGTATRIDIYKLLTARKTTPFYQKRMLEHLAKRKRPFLTSLYCRAVLNACKPQKRPHFKNMLDAADTELARARKGGGG